MGSDEAAGRGVKVTESTQVVSRQVVFTPAAYTALQDTGMRALHDTPKLNFCWRAELC
jgi:hypothetical protein